MDSEWTKIVPVIEMAICNTSRHTAAQMIRKVGSLSANFQGSLIQTPFMHNLYSAFIKLFFQTSHLFFSRVPGFESVSAAFSANFADMLDTMQARSTPAGCIQHLNSLILGLGNDHALQIPVPVSAGHGRPNRGDSCSDSHFA
jgi:hypothetical protein